MEKIRLMIVDSDDHFVDLVRRFLGVFPDMEIIGCENDGHDAVKHIKTLKPDAVLFDLILPGLDGISVLRRINAMNNPPAMICCTRFYSDVALEALRTYGASYLLFKPVELQALHPAILACTELHRKAHRTLHDTNDKESDILQHSAYIRNYIVSLGIPSKLIGCSYLTEAVRLAKSDATLTRNLSKGLYLEISRSMNTTPTRIERCIRNAISIAYQSGELRNRMLNCPSNKEFINFVMRTIDI